MGGCVSSTREQPAVDKARRRLSTSGAFGADSGASKQESSENTHKLETLLELMPEGSRRFSLIGQLTTNTQQGFDDKCTTFVTAGQNRNDDVNYDEIGVGYACKKGLKPESPNQDDFFIAAVDRVCGLYGVFDGHGPYGHDISAFVHQVLPERVLKAVNQGAEPTQVLRQAFVETHKKCAKVSEKGHFDCSLSGTTATVCMVKEEEKALYIAHVGDSRAVMGVRKVGENQPFTVQDLTVDHKPSTASEKQRIHAAGGQVRCLAGDINDRVFLKNKLYPGLAMSRSIGDLVGASAGVTSEPDVNKVDITEESQFVLICSDGVWEFISSQEAVDMVSQYPAGKAMEASEALAQEAWSRWITEEGNVVDDITVILIWLGQDREDGEEKKSESKKSKSSCTEESEKNAADSPTSPVQDPALVPEEKGSK